MQQKEIGMQISAARKKLKYTQRELAEKLGVSDKTISKWERGAGYPDISLLLPLCRELGIEVSQLLGDEETDTQKQGNEKNLKNLADYAVLKVKENRERIQRWIWIMLSALAVLSIGICLLCNYVLEGAISWAWIAAVSVIYGWMILTALLMSHRYLIEKTMLVGMVMLFPYLYCLSLQLPISNFLPLTWTIAAAAAVWKSFCSCDFSNCGNLCKEACKMNPVEKMNELQRHVDAVNHSVMKKREQLMKPTKKQMEISVLVSAGGSVVFLIVAGVVYFVYHLHLQAASCTAIAGLLLLNAGIMKNKKSKS